MTELEKLIKEPCPNGVEYVKIKDTFQRLKGTPITAGKMKEIENANGEIKIFAGGKTVINAYEKDIPNANITRVPAVLVQSRGIIDFIYYEKPFTFKNEMWAYTTDNKITVKYLYYVFQNNTKYFRDSASGMGSLPQISLHVTEDFEIPIPPLKIQEEIVHILDNFTELTAELTARRKQYEYYRDKLLSFDGTMNGGGGGYYKARRIKLKEIATDFFRGSGITRDQVTARGTPCVRYGEIYTTYNIWFDKCVSHANAGEIQNPKYFEHGDILFAITGESVEDIAKSTAYVGHEKCLAGGDIVVMKHQQNPKYLAYALSTYDARQQKSKGKIKSKVVHSNVPSIENIEIPLPPLDVQERIVKVLDNFDAICSDLGIGLPAEIEKRRQQYEYYRDLLLTFSERCDTILTEQNRTEQNRTDEIKLLQYVFGFAFVRLGEIATITRGGNFQKKDFCEDGVPCIHYGQIYTKYGLHTNSTVAHVSKAVADKSKKATTNDIVMAVTSENVEDVCKCVAWLGEESIAVSGHTAIIHHNQNAKYLSYYFHTSMFLEQKKKLAHGTKVIEVTPDSLNNVTIPLPPIEEQKRIVEILDRFDNLCNDISEGLPAEIEARKKQYEHYRDRLLAFDEMRSFRQAQ